MGGGGLFSGLAEEGEGKDGGGEGKVGEEEDGGEKEGEEERGVGGAGEPPPSLLPLLDTFLLILTMMDGSNTQQRAHGRHVEVRRMYLVQREEKMKRERTVVLVERGLVKLQPY